MYPQLATVQRTVALTTEGPFWGHVRVRCCWVPGTELTSLGGTQALLWGALSHTCAEFPNPDSWKTLLILHTHTGNFLQEALTPRQLRAMVMFLVQAAHSYLVATWDTQWARAATSQMMFIILLKI